MSIKESVDELAGVVGSKIDVLVNNAGMLIESSVLNGAPALIILFENHPVPGILLVSKEDTCQCR